MDQELQHFLILISRTEREALEIVRGAEREPGLEQWRRLAARYDPLAAGRSLDDSRQILSPPKAAKIDDLSSHTTQGLQAATHWLSVGCQTLKVKVSCALAVGLLGVRPLRCVCGCPLLGSVCVRSGPSGLVLWFLSAASFQRRTTTQGPIFRQVSPFTAVTVFYGRGIGGIGLGFRFSVLHPFFTKKALP